MSVPKPIGRIHYDEPRAVKVREPENLTDIHSAIHGALAVYVDTVLESRAIIQAWPMIVQAAADKANEILAAMKEAATT